MPTPDGIRILHVSDFHNRRIAYSLTHALNEALDPAVIVNTGDLSGIGGLPERILVSMLARKSARQWIFAPGNHDGPSTTAVLRRLGAAVLSAPEVVERAGLSFLGWPDPNRTRFGRGDLYDVALCKRNSSEIDWPSGTFVVAVHSETMLPDVCPASLVLCGHVHSPLVHRIGETLVVRCGSTGGGGPFGGDVHAAVIDVEESSHSPNAIFLLRVTREGEPSFRRVFRRVDS